MATKSNNGVGGATQVNLKPVGVTEDGSAVLLARRANAKTPEFRLRIDEALLERLEEARDRAERPTGETGADPQPAPEVAPAPAAPPPPVPQVVSKLTPKEVQALLRQGRTVASVAKKAGVDPAWVERFESPIIWERSGMTARARKATLSRSRMGESGAPLGEAVRTNLRAKGVILDEREFVDSWDAVRERKDPSWIVSFSFFYRAHDRVCRWRYDPAEDRLEALDKVAAELGWVARKRRPAARR